jgi:hypothetical protein
MSVAVKVGKRGRLDLIFYFCLQIANGSTSSLPPSPMRRSLSRFLLAKSTSLRRSSGHSGTRRRRSSFSSSHSRTIQARISEALHLGLHQTHFYPRHLPHPDQCQISLIQYLLRLPDSCEVKNCIFWSRFI